MEVDVLIAGGGPAGLSAALILGRCHWTTLLCDDGGQRNLSSHAIHGLLGQEGTSPSAFLDAARQGLTCTGPQGLSLAPAPHPRPACLHAVQDKRDAASRRNSSIQ
jgi:glycine/D-amino acid oxidase-like deaminating enzyme